MTGDTGSGAGEPDVVQRMRPAREDLLLGALLVVVTFATFLPVLDAGYIWDDDGYLTHNSLIHANDGLQRIWLTTEAKDYYPLLYTSFWFQWRMWGDDPMPYHLLNLVQHLIASLLLWPFLPEKISELWQRTGCGHYADALQDRGSGDFEQWRQWGLSKPGTEMHKGDPLFPRFQPAKA